MDDGAVTGLEKRCVWNGLRKAAEDSGSLSDRGRIFKSVGAELDKALKPNGFFVAVFRFFFYLSYRIQYFAPVLLVKVI